MFYQNYLVKTTEKWASFAKDDFRFCPKFTNTITHIKRLNGVERDTDLFLENAGTLHQYLKKLPRDFKVCVELRHPDWYQESDTVNETFEMLRELGVSTVITDASGRRDCVHMKLTTPVAFIRFVGNGLHPTDFIRMDSWAEHIKKWVDMGIETIYFFIHNHEELNSPEMCKYMIKKVNKLCKLDIKVPQLLNETKGKLL